MARAGFWKLVTVPPWELGILESGNCDHFTGTACMHVSRNAKGPSNVARPPARATAWPERASLQRAPRAARHRVGAASERAWEALLRRREEKMGYVRVQERK